MTAKIRAVPMQERKFEYPKRNILVLLVIFKKGLFEKYHPTVNCYIPADVEPGSDGRGI